MKSASELVNEVYVLEQQKQSAQLKLNLVKADIRDKLRVLSEAMGDLRQVKTSIATVTRTSTIVPTIKDWDKVQAWIEENDAMYLLTKKISSDGYRELLKSGEEIPGVEPFDKQGFSVRKVKDG